MLKIPPVPCAAVAARGLDVKDLVLVVNYDVPNHHEDYVHRWAGLGRDCSAAASGEWCWYSCQLCRRWRWNAIGVLVALVN